LVRAGADSPRALAPSGANLKMKLAIMPPTTTNARVATIDKLSVVLVAIFGAVFLGERLSGVNWAGVALIAAGAILVAIRI
jgi:uncharacterized membrane protein